MTTATFIETHFPSTKTRLRSLGLNIARVFLAFILFPGGVISVAADEFQVSLKGGSVITVEVSTGEFGFTKVLSDGEMIKERVRFADLDQLVLSASPASEQVAEIRRLVKLLASSAYLERQLAEEKLSDPKIGGNFKSMIESQTEHPAYEVRYRVARILDELTTEQGDATESEFDRLRLIDGTVIEGDAGEFTLACTYRGQSMTFSRKEIQLITAPTRIKSVANAEQDVRVEMFHDHRGSFYLPEQTTVDFELSPSGAEIRKNTNVNEMFTSFGLKLGAGHEGFVGNSGYTFKFADKPATGNSVCVFENVGTYSRRFKGIMELTFCMPNQASVAAGVNEVGLLMARVNHSRDFIVEAYNADGQILASVESSDEPCPFAGIRSNEPIAKVRILSNPYLFRIDRAIDDDYAVDSICFSTPVPISTSSSAAQSMVRLKNGDLIQGDSIEIRNENSIAISVVNNEPINVGMEEVQALFFAAEPEKSKQKDSWTAMLPDRSTIFVKPGKSFTSVTFPSLIFKPDELMGLWSSKNPARFPVASDFEGAKTVMVFPTCRIAANSVKFSSEGFEWEASAKKIFQPLKIDGDEKAEEDPSPTFRAVEFAKSWSESNPTVWMKSPISQSPGTGQLQLTDGQQLVLGEKATFQLSSLDKKEVTLSVAGKQTKIPLSDVLSIKFPDQPSR